VYKSANTIVGKGPHHVLYPGGKTSWREVAPQEKQSRFVGTLHGDRTVGVGDGTPRLFSPKFETNPMSNEAEREEEELRKRPRMKAP